jgi:aldose 1-epimerase
MWRHWDDGRGSGRRQVLRQLFCGATGVAVSPAVFVGAPNRQNATPTSLQPTGRQFRLALQNQSLVVTEVGATMRSYQVGGREFLWGFGEADLPANSSGQLLLPWPGRCEGGAYEFRGTRYQLAINNVNSQTAQHGLVRHMSWHVAEQQPDRLTLELVLYPQVGYPFVLALRQQYALTNRGLVVTTSATNSGSTIAPYATGMHPYFTVGDMTIDDSIVRIPARQFLPRSATGAATTPMVAVTAELDFRRLTRIGAAPMSAVAYGDLIRDADGRARINLSSKSGRPAVMLWMDEQMDFVTVYAPPGRSALAIEPCTAPSNALNHGLGLRALTPGETTRSSFGVEVAL